METNRPPVYLRLTQQRTIRERQVITPEPAAAETATAAGKAGGKKKGAKKAAKRKPAPRPVEQWVDRVVQFPAYALVHGDCEIMAIEPAERYGDSYGAKTTVTIRGGCECHCAEPTEMVFDLLRGAVGAQEIVAQGGPIPPAMTADGVAFMGDDELERVYILEPAAQPTTVVLAEVEASTLRFDQATRRHMAPLTSGREVDREGFSVREDDDPASVHPLTLNARGERPAEECFHSLDRAWAQLDEIMERRGRDPAPAPGAPAPASEAQDDAAPFLLACGVNANTIVAADVFFAGDDGLTAQGVLVEVGKHEGEPILRISTDALDANGRHSRFIARRPREVYSTFEAAESALAPKRPLRPVHLADGSNALVGLRVYILDRHGAIEEAFIHAVQPRRTRPIMLEGIRGEPGRDQASWVQEVSGAEVYPTRDAALAAAGGSPAEPSAAIPLPGQDEEDEEEAPDSTPIDSGDGRTVSIPEAVCADDPALARDRMTDDGAPSFGAAAMEADAIAATGA